MLLIPAGGYKDDKEATAYTLILQREGSSRMVASVAAYLFSKAGKDCGVVIGEHRTAPSDDKTEEGVWEPWYWNWILDGDRYLFFDLHAAALNGVEPSLLTYEKMKEYPYFRHHLRRMLLNPLVRYASKIGLTLSTNESILRSFV